MSREEDVKENISIHHNVFARNNERQIRLKDDSRVDYVNNVVYGWGWYGSGGKGLNIDTTYTVDPTINVVNNRFHHVATPYGSAGNAIVYAGGVGSAKVFMSGNIVPSAETDTASTSSRHARAFCRSSHNLCGVFTGRHGCAVRRNSLPDGSGTTTPSGNCSRHWR